MIDAASINRLFRAGKLKRDMFGAEVFRPGKSLNITRALNADMLEGRHDGRAKASGGAMRAGYGKKLHSLVGPSRQLARRTSPQGAHAGFDPRQRAIVKIHYFNHSGGGGAALRAHARYVARDAAARAPTPGDVPEPDAPADHAEAKARAHGKYLDRAGNGAAFYDAASDAVDGGERAASWARSDRRHFRLILAPENGTKFGDLRSYTRKVMRRAEVTLGSKLEWVAVDHWDTDNPHTHIILRGVRGDGRDLIIPREFVQHGFRSAARDVATERLGLRTREDDRLALHREVRAHRPTRLDQWIGDQLDKDGKVRIADLRAPNGDPAATDALKGRAQELRRLGLATEVRRNVLQFAPNWRDGLKALELHLDIRKALMQSRAIDAARAQQTGKSISTLLRGGQGPDR
ncbi:VirD2 components [alpha proteobacterium U9-1i]|nr:VirD2 components [alpha proteobacterium U9-1i]